MSRDIVFARCHEAVFFHCRVWPTDLVRLRDALAEWPGRPRWVTIPGDAVSPETLAQLADGLGGDVGLAELEYTSPSPETDELGFRLGRALHEKMLAHGA